MSETRILRETVLFKAENVLKLKPHSVIKTVRFSSSTPHDPKPKKQQELDNLVKGAEGDYNGYMSPATRRQVKGLAENVLVAIKLHGCLDFPKTFPSPQVYPAFVTLTLPAKQMHCDKDIRRECLTPFIQWLTGTKEQGYSGWGVKAYLWVAETQKNGNMHIHLLIDRAVPALRLRQKWNQCLQRLGIIDMYEDVQRYVYRNGFVVRQEMLNHKVTKRLKIARKLKIKLTKRQAIKDETERQLKAYHEGEASGWRNPNSTDIHAIQSIDKLTAYVTKYMTKEAEVSYIRADGSVLKNKLNPGDKAKGITKLADNQRIEKLDKTWELITTTEVIDHTYGKFFEDTREPITIKHDVRKLRGRIWGCSDAIRQDGVKHFETVLSTFEQYEKDVEKVMSMKVWQRTSTTDMFGNVTYSQKQVTEQRTISERIESKRLLHNKETEIYYDLLKETIPEVEITTATAKAGAHFASTMSGEIIPLRDPIYLTLPQDSPSLFADYFDHYANVFKLIWGEPEQIVNSPPPDLFAT